MHWNAKRNIVKGVWKQMLREIKRIDKTSLINEEIKKNLRKIIVQVVQA